MYDILLGTAPVGKAEVQTEGLYYKFSCYCTLPSSDVFRVTVSDGNTTKDLGICVPTGSRFTLTARIPTKYLKGDRLTFILVPNNSARRGIGIPVMTGRPFEQLDKLEAARLSYTNGQPVIVID